MKEISEHFTYEELTYSRIAVENALGNVPGETELKALKVLATNTLEPLREVLGAPIAVTSGFRSPEVNRLAGGVPASGHVKGEAADCYTPLGARYLLKVLLESGIPVDQAILYRKKNFLHISYRNPAVNRKMVLYK